MCLVCEIRICYCVDGCDWSFFSDLRRSFVLDYFFEFGGYIVYEEVGRYVILRYYDIVFMFVRMLDMGFLFYVIYKLMI